MPHAPGNEIDIRGYNAIDDSHRLECRHTALDPVKGFDNRKGMFTAIRFRCTNCGAVLDVIPGTGHRGQ